MSDRGTLVDQRAREQIATDVARRLAVNAAAGSGKTTSLVERIVSLVSAHDVPVASIAAITFTEAAAAELRVRVRTAMEEGAAADPTLATAARDVDDAAICTIHAFARRILSENWLEAGLPPIVEVLDAAGEYLDHKTRWAQFTDELLSDESAAPTLMRGFAAGLRLGQLAEVGRALGQHHDRLTPEVLATLDAQRTHSANPAVDVGEIVRCIGVARTLGLGCTDDSDTLLLHISSRLEEARRRLEPLVGSDDETTILSILRKLPSLANTHGKQQNWPDVGEVRDACRAVEEACDAVLERVRTSVVTELGYRLARWAVDGAAFRRAEGRFTFHDLLVEARTLLRDNASVRARVRDRYRCVLIDEFQDTDPLQAELAALLGEPAEGDATARLFVVGDPEQSIYRFRRADVAQFEAAVETMDDEITLASNFRSVPEVLAFVDMVFEGLAGEITRHHGVAHRSLVATREPPHGPIGHPVAVFGGPDAEGRARDVRIRATAEVAAAVRSVVAEGWTVEDDAVLHPARFGDVAILLPTRTSLPMLERAFDAADVPYRLEGASLVWASQDVRDLLAIARAVDDPANPIAVVAALRTPALACGDDDLIRFHSVHRSWDPRADHDGEDDLDDPVTRAMAILAGLHRRRMWMTPSEMISTIITDLRFFELALVHRRPRDHWQRLRWLQEQVRAFDETTGGSLGEFLEWVDLSDEAERWTSTLGAPEPDDDAVRVMTVHGAKGLEFPIVILTGLDTAPPTMPPPVLFDEAGIPLFSFGVDFRSEDFKGRSDADRSRDAAERLRLLYVALTRARDHLVIDLGHKEAANQALAAKLFSICGGAVAQLTPTLPPHEARVAAPAPRGDAGWWAEHERWLHARARLVRERARQPAWSATALAAAGAGLFAQSHSTRAWDQETQRRIGRAVHDALSKIQLSTEGTMSEDDVAVAGAAADAQRLNPSARETVVALTRSALGSTLLRSIAAGRHWKELPLAAPLPGGGMLEGFADLVGESPDGLVVVDFKTVHGDGSSSQYLGQVAAYAYAIGRATGRAVTRVVVCYLRDDGTDEETLEGDALDTKIDQVVRAMDARSVSADAADARQLSLFGAA